MSRILFKLQPTCCKYLYRSIARFRLSFRNLHIELGRHKRPYVVAEERICKRCDTNDTKDEFHCLIIVEIG